ncbi:hypothetical protein U9M48_011079 [Paspalum notatum var. saurae]|uniref:Pectinesterase inhibitor domain-containing protein n=1 Tax=Paspalum notatum var. saurae TaxID=547442 RepID=A0AAQ3SWG1_PASNO
MEARSFMSCYCGSLLGAAAEPSAKGASTARDLAEAAIRAASTAGAAAGDYARAQLDVAKDNAAWQCLSECADDIEDALSHLDDSEGQMDDAKIRDVKLFLDTSDQDAWDCDDGCKHAPQTPVKAQLLAKNKAFEDLMAVTHVLVKRAIGGAAPAPAPAPSMSPKTRALRQALPLSDGLALLCWAQIVVLLSLVFSGPGAMVLGPLDTIQCIRKDKRIGTPGPRSQVALQPPRARAVGLWRFTLCA